MQKTILIIVGGLFLVILAGHKINKSVSEAIGVFSEIPDRVQDLGPYERYTEQMSRNMDTMTWEEYRAIEKSRLILETKYIKVATKILQKASQKGQLKRPT